MKSLRSRFILSHLLPILITVPLVMVILLYLLETQILLAQTSQDISDKANLIAQTVNGRPELLQSADDAEGFLTGVSIYMDERVLLLRPNGQILATIPSESGTQEGAIVELEGLDTAISGSPSLIINYGLTNGEAIALVPVMDINQQLIGIVGVTEGISGAASDIGRLRTWILILLFFELLLGGIIGLWLAGRLAKPIHRAAQAVIDIAGGRDIGPVRIDGPTEIRELSAAVNVLSERLRLLEESRRRSLANIVHELGRPLGAMRSAVHVLRQSPGEDPQVRDELLAGVEQAIENMQPLLDDLSQLHGQVEGTIQLQRQPIALGDWLVPLLLPWRTVAQEKGLGWRVEVDKDIPEIAIDPDRLAQAVGNLLSNAIKYTPVGGTVQVTAAAAAEEVYIGVCDSGVGIAPGERAMIFEPFYRSTQERRFPQGLGLGLTIARDLVEAHGGRLEVADGQRTGSCFTIYLPLHDE
ncbi:MAG: HAMP domain-containing sensor histidine kinase [Candidatus Promineifilaceae bacterium]|nr:HAMP domain-containing sensor histidine kinase [Candidatus Promineifilaceae bacterium]